MNKLAEGSFSTVYSASNKTVIKRYKMIESLYREIHIMDLCKLTDYILQPITKGNDYITLPLMSPLSNLDINILRIKDRHKIIHSLIKGLKELHNLEIIHHDIKLDNILFDPLNLCIKFADFSSSFTIDEFGQLSNKQKVMINDTTSPLHKFYRKIININDLYDSDKWSLIITILQFYNIDARTISSPKNAIDSFKKLRRKYPSDALLFSFVLGELLPKN